MEPNQHGYGPVAVWWHRRMGRTAAVFIALTCGLLLGPLGARAQQGVQPDGISYPFRLTQWTEASAMPGELSHQTFQGPETGQPVEYWIYLPEGYHGTDTQYPVIYHLHGLTLPEHGGWGSAAINDLYEPASISVIEWYEKARAQKVIGPAILVFPNGYGNTLWSDSKTSEKPAETNVIKELIPYIDATYRTLPAPKYRAIQGFSMGGFGAFKYAAKFPELFSAAVNYDGALHSWETISTLREAITQEIYGNDEAYFAEHAPWIHITRGATALARAGVALKANIGSITEYNRKFRDHLTSHGLTVSYTETSCGHDLGCLLTETGIASFAFIANRMSQPDGDVKEPLGKHQVAD